MDNNIIPTKIKTCRKKSKFTLVRCVKCELTDNKLFYFTRYLVKLT